MSMTLICSVWLLCALASGQDFSVPSTWRKPTSSLSREDREALASAVVDSMSTRFDASTGLVEDSIYDESAYFLTAIARTDYLSGNTSYQDLVLENVNVRFQLAPGLTDYSAWGLAAINAHIAYSDPQSLNLAISVWDQMFVYQIQPSDVAQGFLVAQSNTSIPSSCNGTSVAGAVFAAAGSTNTDVDGATVAAFLALAGHLYEATGESKYLNTAELAAQFIQNHMVSCIQVCDTFIVGSCQVDTGIGPLMWDAGFALWGLSILATNNKTWTPLLNNLIASTVPFAEWTNPTDGILGESQGDISSTTDLQRSLKAIFIRGVQEAWIRASPSSDVATYLKSFLLVQFNSLVDLATVPGSNMYSPVWEGPPQPALIEWGQLCALDVLNSAFAVVPKNNTDSATASDAPSSLSATGSVFATNSPSPTNIALTPTAAPSSVSRSKSNTAVIAGATMGGVLSLFIFVVLFVFLRRKNTHRSIGPSKLAGNKRIMPILPPPYDDVSTSTEHCQHTEGEEKEYYASLLSLKIAQLKNALEKISISASVDKEKPQVLDQDQ